MFVGVVIVVEVVGGGVCGDGFGSGQGVNGGDGGGISTQTNRLAWDDPIKCHYAPPCPPSPWTMDIAQQWTCI